MFWAAFHRTVSWHTSWFPETHSLVHWFGTAKITRHTRVAIFHHHLLRAIVMAAKAMMFHLANTTCNKANEEDESNCDKEPCNKGKEFAGHLFSEFCK